MNVEIWRDVKGFEGLYQVSNLGNVKSLKCHKEMILKKCVTNGRSHISMHKDKKQYHFEVGRLVAQAFLPNPNNYQIVTYKDYNPANCKVSNLRWCKNRREFKQTTPFRYRIVVKYNGEKFRTQRELAERYGIAPVRLAGRKKQGWSLEEALTIPVSKKHCHKRPFVYEYYGEKLTVEQISNITGIPKGRIQRRLNHNWSIYEAAEIPVAVTNTGKRRNK